MERPVKNGSRIEVVDALRGFAVMAIILVHNLEHFIFPVYPEAGRGGSVRLTMGCSARSSLSLRARHTPLSPCCSASPSTCK